ncbi:hypothetical protein GCM10007989_13540 [Devosia pacifica]|uniref:Uncharacterized protein n=1 Tax=Devosia pacifica TaxID=1335967 RepID=A0A918S3S8_9HYPH|nr:hypothetical protein [Devosia pacifica]GHA19316.1 hypothetical protein GCM10007989_13540 [Devosia pacifica]
MNTLELMMLALAAILVVSDTSRWFRIAILLITLVHFLPALGATPEVDFIFTTLMWVLVIGNLIFAIVRRWRWERAGRPKPNPVLLFEDEEIELKSGIHIVVPEEQRLYSPLCGKQEFEHALARAGIRSIDRES